MYVVIDLLTKPPWAFDTVYGVQGNDPTEPRLRGSVLGTVARALGFGMKRSVLLFISRSRVYMNLTCAEYMV